MGHPSPKLSGANSPPFDFSLYFFVIVSFEAPALSVRGSEADAIERYPAVPPRCVAARACALASPLGAWFIAFRGAGSNE